MFYLINIAPPVLLSYTSIAPPVFYSNNIAPPVLLKSWGLRTVTGERLERAAETSKYKGDRPPATHTGFGCK